MSSYVDQIRQKLLAPPVPEKKWRGLSTGLHLLNLAISNNPKYGLRQNYVYIFTGRSSSGKTWLMMQILAEASINEKFSKYHLVLDQPERGAWMDVAHYFGKELNRRLEIPRHSVTLKDFYKRCSDLVKEKKAFILGLDSEDALLPIGEDKMGMQKAKTNAAGIRVAHNDLEKKGSIIIMIKQARQNVNIFTAKYKPDTRSGGTALGYFTGIELWFKHVGTIRRTKLGIRRDLGELLRIEVQKNRESGRRRSVTIPFYPDYGFDDTESMVRWLVDEGCWRGKDIDKGGKIEVNLSGIESCTVDKLCERIERKGLVDEVLRQVCERWKKIEEACALKRKPRYA